MADILLFDNVSSKHRPNEQTGSAGTADSYNARLLSRLSAKDTPNTIKKS